MVRLGAFTGAVTWVDAPQIERLTWSCVRRSASTTEVSRWRPMRVLPAMMALERYGSFQTTSVAPIAAKMARLISSAFESPARV